MNIKNIENRITEIEIPKTQDFEFLYSVLLAYGKSQASITRLKKGTYNFADDKDHEVYWKNVVLFRFVEDHDLHLTIDDLKRSTYGQKHNPRFVIVTDLDQLLAIDTKTGDTLEIALNDFARHYAFFLPWAGMEKSQLITENEADVKAAERMAKLYDEIIGIEENATADPVFYHNLNVFFSRLLFCFFAEDTNVFKQSQFTRAISDYTQHDGSDLNTFLDELFRALDEENRSNYPVHIASFPYVNGGLFRNHVGAPKFNAKARGLILSCGELDWSAINPDIFGSMIQAVVHPGQRAVLGMHYTSVVNITKVIEPLFINSLRKEFDNCSDDTRKLDQLLARISAIKVFDPACGSGNFLIISYKELRRLEHAILERQGELIGLTQRTLLGSRINIENFYGIEIDDFAHEVAILSLWLAKHQMNIEFAAKFGIEIPLIPLKEAGNIVQGNAANTDWQKVCKNNGEDEIYIIGNPPYLGASLQDADQKSDMKNACEKSLPGYKKLDYISIWFIKGAEYISKSKAKLAFVSTNSISQGEQVALLWPQILTSGLEIQFAYTSFKWANNARNAAGVTCVIIALAFEPSDEKRIYAGSLSTVVKHINAYLAEGSDIVIDKRSRPISRIPEMIRGNIPYDDGNLLLSQQDYTELIEEEPGLKPLIKRYGGAFEMLNSKWRYCIWLMDKDLEDVLDGQNFIQERIDKVRSFRLKSKTASVHNKSSTPFLFGDIRQPIGGNYLMFPRVSSERREYLPISYLDSNTIMADSCYGVPNARLYLFGIFSSKIHATWIRSVAGRLKTDYRYSSSIVYNNFPIPELSSEQIRSIENNVLEVLDVREKHSEKTLTELYDPLKMPKDLLRAHQDLDQVIDRCYRVRPFDNDEDRLSHLFKLYEIMLPEQKELISA